MWGQEIISHKVWVGGRLNNFTELHGRKLIKI